MALSLSERSPDDLLRGLHEHRIEAAFLFAPYRDEALRARCVSTQRLVAALPERHPLAARDAVDVRALAEGPMILPTQHETPGLFSRIRLLFDELDLQPNVVQRDVWMMQTIIGLVAAEMGAAIVPSSVTELRRDGVVYRRLEQDVAPVEMTVAWRRDTGPPPLPPSSRRPPAGSTTSQPHNQPARRPPPRSESQLSQQEIPGLVRDHLNFLDRPLSLPPAIPRSDFVACADKILLACAHK